MDNMEKVSVIVPVYNVEKYLKKCLDSIRNQTYDHLEILLVDDGSTDNSGKICDEYGKKDSRVIAIHQMNGGLSAARNRGIEIASGEFILFVDSDDYIASDMIEKLYLRLKETRSDMAVCGIQYVDENEVHFADKSPNHFSFKDGILTKEMFWNIYASVGHTECVVTWNKLYKKEIFKEIRYPAGRVREDEFVLHDIVDKCERIVAISERLVFYRQRNNSIMGKKEQKMEADYLEANFERLDFFMDKADRFMTEDTIVRLIASVERYHLKYEAGYKEWKERIKQKLDDPKLLLNSKKGKLIIKLYKYDLFPYKLVHKILLLKNKQKERN